MREELINLCCAVWWAHRVLRVMNETLLVFFYASTENHIKSYLYADFELRRGENWELKKKLLALNIFYGLMRLRWSIGNEWLGKWEIDDLGLVWVEFFFGGELKKLFWFKLIQNCKKIPNFWWTFEFLVEFWYFLVNFWSFWNFLNIFGEF